jgi:elongation factor P hydroxylase
MPQHANTQATHMLKNHQDLAAIFHQCFAEEFDTRLQGNAAEPLYTPRGSGQNLHTIFYREDYFSSALHEVAHWCIAGEKRRQMLDYGYWYAPDGRSAQQQADFEKVECKPQALEWAFSIACDIPFSVSIDNLTTAANADADTISQQQNAFIQAVNQQLHAYVEDGFRPRAQTFLAHLHDFYQTQALCVNDVRLKRR